MTTLYRTAKADRASALEHDKRAANLSLVAAFRASPLRAYCLATTTLLGASYASAGDLLGDRSLQQRDLPPHDEESATGTGLSAQQAVKDVIRQTPPLPHFRKKHPVKTTGLGPADVPPKPWSQWQTMTGDWGGTRSDWVKKGVLWELVYSAEVMSRISGGDKSEDDTSGLGNADLTLTLDTGSLGWWKGGTFFFYLQNMVGDGNEINDAAGGPLAPISTFDSDDFTQVSAYYYEQQLCDGSCRIKFGKHDANSEFVAMDITGEYINAGFSPPANIPMPTFPDPALGLVVEVDPSSALYVRAGVYGADLDGQSLGDSGLFEGDTISFLESGWTTAAMQRYAGTYSLGAWYTTLETAEVVPDSNPDAENRDDNYGVYLMVSQPLYLEPSANDASGPGLVAFFEYSWAPESRNAVAEEYALGAMYTGLFPSRTTDELGFGVTLITPSDNLGPNGPTEDQTNYELFYKANLTPWLYIQPDVQWVDSVGGTNEDATVIGARVGITF
ncbi:MAG: carbohydrate porin [Pseudomonadota bacterium]